MVKPFNYRAHIIILKNNTASYSEILLKIKKTTSIMVLVIRLKRCRIEIYFSVMLHSTYLSSFWFWNLVSTCVIGFSMSFPPVVSTY